MRVAKLRHLVRIAGMYSKLMVESLPSYGKKALILSKHTTFGNRLECVMERQELKEDFMLMVGLTLELAKFTESTCPNFTEGFYLTMAQFAEAGVLGLNSLENMPKTEVKAMLSHVSG